MVHRYIQNIFFFIFIQDWRFIRALLSKVGEESFLNKLHNIDCSKITTDTALKAKEWIKHVETSDQVKAVSLAGYQIHLWVSKETSIIMLTGPLNLDPRKPHSYVVKRGVQGYTIFFIFFFLQNIRLWVLCTLPYY